MAAVATVLSATLLVLFGWTFPATAAVEQEQAATGTDDATQAIVVGSIAFVIMIAAAGAVMWFTAKARAAEIR
ncbi:hypothetical protein CFN78_09055 [Amycolatopsis antarctica]|uniref:Uncharacterized protein n=1 Tax=Amycolatopsis antarctica TaxID=1854586 RepID=A0A263D5C5_9PSEU|nr:hypothetical protein [Amycolatopsis antarctica]OZM73660.1 hypothetical protein CFN78_09055 [Amycolatopsis antarctica]